MPLDLPVWLVEVLHVGSYTLNVSRQILAPVLPALTPRDVPQNRAVLPEASGLAAIVLEAAPVGQARLVKNHPSAYLAREQASISASCVISTCTPMFSVNNRSISNRRKQ